MNEPVEGGKARALGVNLAGYIASEKGVGEALRSQIRCLEAAAIPYVLNDFPDSGSANLDGTHTQFSAENPYAINLVHLNASEVERFADAKGEAYFRGRYNIGYWNWELSDFPAAWLESFAYFDEIWTPSRFALDAISRVAPIPVVRLPLSLAEPVPPVAVASPLDDLPEGVFVFLFIFDFHSVLARKNPLGLLKAFRQAFGDSQDALLVLKCSRATENERELLSEAAAGINARILHQVLRREELEAVMRRADCYVSLHRAEGFGLTLAEAMYRGKPVIATNYSGNLDFMNASNSLPVNYTLVEIERACGPYPQGAVWAEPDLHHAAAQMRFAFANREAAAAIGRQAQQDIARMLRPQVVGEMLRQRLARILPKAQTRLPLPASPFAVARTPAGATSQTSSNSSAGLQTAQEKRAAATNGQASTVESQELMQELARGRRLATAINEVPLKSSGWRRRLEFACKRYLKWLVHWNTQQQAEFNDSVSRSLQMLSERTERLTDEEVKR